MDKELTILDGTKEEGIDATKKLFGLSPEQSFQDLDVDEENENTFISICTNALNLSILEECK